MDFEKHKGARFHRYFHSITIISLETDKIWWCNGRWMTHEDARATRLGCSSHAPCRSLRAFRRHLRRHGEAGVRYALVNRYINYGVVAVGRGGRMA